MQTQTPFHAMVYERFPTMSFAAKRKRLPHAICEPEFSTARLSFSTKGKKKMLYSLKGQSNYWIKWRIHHEGN
jgi:hypothetical protein